MNHLGLKTDVQILFIGVSDMLIRAALLLVLMSCNVSYAGLFGDDKAREQIKVLQDQLIDMDARIAKIEAVLKNQTLVEFYTQIETLTLEQGKLRGQIEMLSNQNVSLQKRQKDFYIDLDNRLRRIEDPNAPIAAIITGDTSTTTEISTLEPITTSPPSTISETLSIKNIEPAGIGEDNLYKAASNLFRNGDYAGAISQFKILINNYPESSLAPGAAYWIGNAHYASRDFSQAIAAQQNLIQTYPNSDKVPDALLNIASSQQEMGDRKVTKATLQDLITNYPFSDAAKKAKHRLANYR